MSEFPDPHWSTAIPVAYHDIVVTATYGDDPGRLTVGFDRLEDSDLSALTKYGLIYEPNGLGVFYLTLAGWDAARHLSFSIIGEELYPGYPDYLS